MKYVLMSIMNDLWYKYFRFIAVKFLLVFAQAFFIFKLKKKALVCCAASLRYGLTPTAMSLYKKILEVEPYTCDDFSVGVSLDEASARSIIIKWPEVCEGKLIKGVIVITFTRTFSFYLREIDIQKLEEFFCIVLEPSWSGYADPDIMGFIGRGKEIYVQASEVEDRVLMSIFPETFIPVSFGASDWVDSKIFISKAHKKIYDSVYIANTNPIKRVRRYLEAIKNIVRSGNKEYVGCLVCASWGGAQSLIEKMVERYDLKENIIVKFSLTREQVIDCLNSSKVNLLLSYKEGSNRSLFEAMFCNVPVICLHENVGVNKAYINEFTGALVADCQLESIMLWFVENYVGFSPRDWAMKNISPNVTTDKLIQLIADRGNDIAPFGKSNVFIKTNNPEVSYFDYPTIKHKEHTRELLVLFGKCTDEAKLGDSIQELKQSFDSRIHSV